MKLFNKQNIFLYNIMYSCHVNTSDWYMEWKSDVVFVTVQFISICQRTGGKTGGILTSYIFFIYSVHLPLQQMQMIWQTSVMGIRCTGECNYNSHYNSNE